MALQLSSLRGIQAYDKVNNFGSGFSQDQHLGCVHCDVVKHHLDQKEALEFCIDLSRGRTATPFELFGLAVPGQWTQMPLSHLAGRAVAQWILSSRTRKPPVHVHPFVHARR